MFPLAVADFLGFAAAGLTLLTFWQRAMLPMRLCAIGANICFVVYAALASLPPVMALHVVLLPLNIKRLMDLRAGAAAPSTRLEVEGEQTSSRAAVL